MKYLNLEPFSDSQQIEIKQCSKIWDLHNAADFIGHDYNEETKELALSWDYGCDCPNIKGGTVTIKCIGVRLLLIAEKDPEVPRSEDSCVDYFVQINQNSVVFAFRGGQSFEVECEEIQWLPNSTTGHDA